MITAFISGTWGWICFHACSVVQEIHSLTFIGQRSSFPHWLLAGGQSLLLKSALIPSHNFHITSPSSKRGCNGWDLLSHFTADISFLFSSFFLYSQEKFSDSSWPAHIAHVQPACLEVYKLLNFRKSSLPPSSTFTEFKDYGQNIFSGYFVSKRCIPEKSRRMGKHEILDSSQ